MTPHEPEHDAHEPPTAGTRRPDRYGESALLQATEQAVESVVKLALDGGLSPTQVTERLHRAQMALIREHTRARRKGARARRITRATPHQLSLLGALAELNGKATAPQLRERTLARGSHPRTIEGKSGLANAWGYIRRMDGYFLNVETTNQGLYITITPEGKKALAEAEKT